MESILLMTFNEPVVGHRAMSELRRLHSDRAVAVRTAAVLERQADGRFRILEDADNIGLTATASGGLVGALLGALAGPAGVLLGGAAGAVVGAVSDADEAGASELLLTTVASRVAPGATVVVVDADEPVPGVLDAVVRRLGGELTRHYRPDVEAELEAAGEVVRAAEEDVKPVGSERSEARGEETFEARVADLNDNARAK